MKHVILNGEVIPFENLDVNKLDRGFHFGDGFFETIRMNNKEVFLLKNHFLRIQNGFEILSFSNFDSISIIQIEEQLLELYQVNELQNDARAKITFFRSGQGKYLPHSMEASYLIEVEDLGIDKYELNNKGIKLGVYEETEKKSYPWSFIKSLNSQLYIQASIYAKKNLFDDVLIKGERGDCIESTSSNLFVVVKGAVYTPPANSGCVNGVMKSEVINLCLDNGIKIYEHNITVDFLKKAEEVFLSNSISGIKWVGAFKSSRYFHKTSEKLIQLLNSKKLHLKLDL